MFIWFWLHNFFVKMHQLQVILNNYHLNDFLFICGSFLWKIVLKLRNLSFLLSETGFLGKKNMIVIQQLTLKKNKNLDFIWYSKQTWNFHSVAQNFLFVPKDKKNGDSTPPQTGWFSCKVMWILAYDSNRAKVNCPMQTTSASE